MSALTLHRSAVLGVLTAALIGLTVHDPANAATHVTFGALIPATPANAIQSIARSSTCLDADSNARITDPYPAEWLKLVASQSNHSTAEVLLDLDSVGNVMHAGIATSSGNTFIDEQALVAARGSKYAPEVRSCSSFKRSYYLDITFDTPRAVMPPAAGLANRHYPQ